MHKIQNNILDLAKKEDIGNLTLREIASKIGEINSSPQKIKHHLEQLINKGFDVYKKAKNNSSFYSIPLIGTADCGDASMFAEQNYSGFLTISKSFNFKFRDIKNIFAIKVEGDSMNKAMVNEKKIEDGDFLLIDRSQLNPKNGEIVLAIVNDGATIKKYMDDRRENNRIVLMPDSTRSYNPIFINEEDDFRINGKVVDIIKKPILK